MLIPERSRPERPTQLRRVQLFVVSALQALETHSLPLSGGSHTGIGFVGPAGPESQTERVAEIPTKQKSTKWPISMTDSSTRVSIYSNKAMAGCSTSGPSE